MFDYTTSSKISREREKEVRVGGEREGTRESEKERERANDRTIVYITCKSWHIRTASVLELSVFLNLFYFQCSHIWAIFETCLPILSCGSKNVLSPLGT